MKNLLMTTAAAIAISGAATAAPVLSVTATDNGVSLTFVPATNVPGNLTGSFTDSAFSQISVDLTGAPAVASPDFGTVDLSVEGSSGGTHIIDIVATQSGLTEPAGFNGALTMTNNNLIGGAGPTTQTFSINGIPLDTFTFPASPAADASELFNHPSLGAISSETQEFAITFTARGQDLEATQEFTAAAVSEPTSLFLLGTSLIGLGFISRRRRHPEGWA